MGKQKNRPCVICGTIYTPKNSAGRYCTPKCAKEGEKRNQRKRRATETYRAYRREYYKEYYKQDRVKKAYQESARKYGQTEKGKATSLKKTLDRYHTLGGKGFRRSYSRLFYEQQGLCALCFGPIIKGEVDHKVPRDLLKQYCIPASIINQHANLQAVCKSCNSSKGNKMLPQYQALLIQLLMDAGTSGIVQGDLFD